MQITEDLILGARYRSSLTGTALYRTFDVGGLLPGRDTLAQAASAIDSSSGARIPRYGDPHPAVAGLYANQIEAEPMRGSQTAARVSVRYGPPEVAAIPGAVSIRITGVYENKKHAWYRVMTHMGMYIDKAQPPQGRCDPYIVGPGGVHRTDIDPHLGVWNRHWTGHPDPYCGVRGAKPCDLPETSKPVEKPASTITISQFTYSPGSRTAGSGAGGEIAETTYGKPITFVDLDRSENIRHTITTCRWPCNGPYVGNYPTADGRWNSGTLGYDPIDGGDDVFTVTTPKDLPRGRYAYFCLIHPWMRGAFEIK